MLGVKLQALVYDILPSTTAVFSYPIGSRKLSANEQGGFSSSFFLSFCCLFVVVVVFVCSNSSKFVTNNSNKTRRVIKFTPAQIKPQSFESRGTSFFHPGWMCLMFTCVLGR